MQGNQLPPFPQGMNLLAQVPGLGDQAFECFFLRRSNSHGVLLVEVIHGCGNSNCSASLWRDATRNIPSMMLCFKCFTVGDEAREKVFLQIMAMISTIHCISDGVEAFALAYEDGRRIEEATVAFKIGHKVQVLDFQKDGHALNPVGHTVWAGEMRGGGGEHKLTTRNLQKSSALIEMSSLAVRTNHYLVPTLRCIVDGLYRRSHCLASSSVHWDARCSQATTTMKLLADTHAIQVNLPCLRVHVSFSEMFISHRAFACGEPTADTPHLKTSKAPCDGTLLVHDIVPSTSSLAMSRHCCPAPLNSPVAR